jgi:hypothetical protein
MTTQTQTVAPEGIRARRGRKPASKSELRNKLNPKGNTVLRDFGRVLRDEPHKYIYPLKLYMVNDNIRSEPVLEWLRERYIESRGGVHHGTRYEVHTFKSIDGNRYIDYILLEGMTDEEKTLFTLRFGNLTDQKIIRDGKRRRPRLTKTEKKTLDNMVEAYYLEIEKARAAAMRAEG